MSLPKHNELWLPILDVLSKNESMRINEFVDPLAKHFNLSEEDIDEEYSSGNGNIFYDRISWALSYLSMANLIERPKRGTYKITTTGSSAKGNYAKIEEIINKAMATREPSRKKKTTDTADIKANTVSDTEITPNEKLDAAYIKIRQTIYDDILKTILSKTPYEFEKLVVSLLQKMGYGGEILDSGTVTKASCDYGVDGIIKEDILGFDTIHIQAKRYKLDLGVSREEVQKFVGALGGFKSNKGVFITTSYFKKTAIEYANNQSLAKLVLIDGENLAKYIYDYGLGMQTEKVLELKKLDSDFWDLMKDDTSSKNGCF